jgi:predicted AlkP superfamily pyrophosphatase or phosphodiesterase
MLGPWKHRGGGVYAVFLLVLGLASNVASAEPATDRIVVLLLFDGWAPALVDAGRTPTLDRIRAEGSWTHDLAPVFPSISLINQVTISTGCWPERHGIVTNEFIDPERGRYDHDHDADWLLACEHLHQAAERQGVRAAALGWVGRFSTTRGPLASIVSEEKQWSDFPEDDERARQIVRLLELPVAQRPSLIVGYFRGPDNSAHFHGMEAEETRAAVERSDAAVARIVGGIEALSLRDRVAVLITTDHGMVPVSTNVNVARILRNHGIVAEAVSSGTTSFLYFSSDAQVGEAAERLSKYEQFEVVRKQSQPSAWRLGSGPRVGDLILSARPPYFIEDIHRWPWWLQWLGRWGPEFVWAKPVLKASHGYPPETPGMAGILYAWGAGVARGREVRAARAIDVHPTAARLLGIAPGSPVDGVALSDLLAPDPAEPNAGGS